MTMYDIIKYNSKSRSVIHPLEFKQNFADVIGLHNTGHPDVYTTTYHCDGRGKYLLTGYCDVDGSIIMTRFNNKNSLMNCDKRFKENGYIVRIIADIKED